MRRAAAEDLEADYFFDCRNAVDEEIELRAQAATAQEVKEEGAAMGAAETELFVEELIVRKLAGRHGDAIVDAFAKEGVALGALALMEGDAVAKQCGIPLFIAQAAVAAMEKASRGESLEKSQSTVTSRDLKQSSAPDLAVEKGRFWPSSHELETFMDQVATWARRNFGDAGGEAIEAIWLQCDNIDLWSRLVPVGSRVDLDIADGPIRQLPKALYMAIPSDLRKSGVCALAFLVNRVRGEVDERVTSMRKEWNNPAPANAGGAPRGGKCGAGQRGRDRVFDPKSEG